MTVMTTDLYITVQCDIYVNRVDFVQSLCWSC